MMEDKDKDVERRDYQRARALRFGRPAMIIIEGCIDAEQDSVAKMALRHLNQTRFDSTDFLINYGICDIDKMGEKGYHLLDDINATVLEAYIAGYTAAITGEKK
jgi:hypothetical protein